MKPQIYLIIVFLLTYTYCINHQKLDIVHKQQRDYVHQQQGCRQQQTNKGQTAIQGCQVDNLNEAGICMNKFLNTNPKQKWNIFIVQKGKPDDLLIPQKRCLIKKKYFGDSKRDYYLWPIYEPSDLTKVEKCSWQLGITIDTCAKCKNQKDYTQKALAVLQFLTTIYHKKFNVIIREQSQSSYRKTHSFSFECQTKATIQQDGKKIQYLAWID